MGNSSCRQASRDLPVPRGMSEWSRLPSPWQRPSAGVGSGREVRNGLFSRSLFPMCRRAGVGMRSDACHSLASSIATLPGVTSERMKQAPKAGPQAKVYCGAVHPACGGAERWLRNGDDTRRTTSFGLRWTSATRFARFRMLLRFGQALFGLVFGKLWQEVNPIKVSSSGHRTNSTSCSEGGRSYVADQNRPYPSGSTLHFPSCGPKIGAHHSLPSMLWPCSSGFVDGAPRPLFIPTGSPTIRLGMPDLESKVCRRSF